MASDERTNLSPQDYAALGQDAERLKFLLRFAILAPSSHNTQPWLFCINDKTISIRVNEQRALPASDPTGRQLYISLGAALGNLLLAAESYGLAFHLNNFDPAKPQNAAEVVFDGLTSTKFDQKKLKAIIERHNNRSPFEDKNPPEPVLDSLKKTGGQLATVALIGEQSTKKQIQDVVEKAMAGAFTDKKFMSELSRWFHPSLKKYKDGFVGYNLGIPWLLSFVMPWMMKHANVAKSQIKMHREMLEHAPYFGVILTAADDMPAWIAAGEAFERMSVEAEMNGIKIGALAAPIEIGEGRKRLQSILNTDKYPQAFFRLGYTESIPQSSPRINAEELIVK